MAIRRPWRGRRPTFARALGTDAGRGQNCQWPCDVHFCLPIGFGFKSDSWFTNYKKIHRTSDWLKLGTTGILKFCLRGLLGKRQRLVLFCLLDCLRDIAASVHTAAFFSLDTLESLIHETLAEVELNFPASLHVVMLHLLHHSVVAIQNYCTMYST